LSPASYNHMLAARPGEARDPAVPDTPQERWMDLSIPQCLQMLDHAKKLLSASLNMKRSGIKREAGPDCLLMVHRYTLAASSARRGPGPRPHTASGLGTVCSYCTSTPLPPLDRYGHHGYRYWIWANDMGDNSIDRVISRKDICTPLPPPPPCM